MNQLIVDDHVVWSDICGKEHRGKPAGTVLGFHQNGFVILLNHTPDSENNKASVVHVSAVTKAPVA